VTEVATKEASKDRGASGGDGIALTLANTSRTSSSLEEGEAKREEEREGTEKGRSEVEGEGEEEGGSLVSNGCRLPLSSVEVLEAASSPRTDVSALMLALVREGYCLCGNLLAPQQAYMRHTYI